MNLNSSQKSIDKATAHTAVDSAHDTELRGKQDTAKKILKTNTAPTMDEVPIVMTAKKPFTTNNT